MNPQSNSPAFPAAPLLMDPHFSVRPWGGTRLAQALGKNVPEGSPIGESWELSDHPNGLSKIASGPLRGREFAEVLRSFPSEMIGRNEAPEMYPLLVKILDAAEDLSIQVHPNDDDAVRLGGEDERGKTECWFVMDCPAGGEVIYGLKRGITPDDLKKGAIDGRITSMVQRRPIHRGSFIPVEAGTVHALLGGTMVCEIQQSCDTTFRIWDWNRQPRRELHLSQALQVIDYERGRDGEFAALEEPGGVARCRELSCNQYYRVRAIDIPAGTIGNMPGELVDSGVILICVSGLVRLEAREGSVDLSTGSTAFLPALCKGEATIHPLGGAPARVLVAESLEL